MIDTALALDPRIKAFRAAEKAAREAKRKGGVANGGAPVDPKVKAEEERKAKEEAEKAAADQAAKDASDKVRSSLTIETDSAPGLLTERGRTRPIDRRLTARRQRRPRPPPPRTSRRTRRRSRIS